MKGMGREERKKNTNRKREKGKDQPNSPKIKKAAGKRLYLFIYVYSAGFVYLFLNA